MTIEHYPDKYTRERPFHYEIITSSNLKSYYKIYQGNWIFPEDQIIDGFVFKGSSEGHPFVMMEHEVYPEHCISLEHRVGLKFLIDALNDKYESSYKAKNKDYEKLS